MLVIFRWNIINLKRNAIFYKTKTDFQTPKHETVTFSIFVNLHYDDDMRESDFHIYFCDIFITFWGGKEEENLFFFDVILKYIKY